MANSVAYRFSIPVDQLTILWMLGIVLYVPNFAIAETDYVAYLLRVDEDGPGTFNIYAEVGDGNSGLGQFAIEIFGADTITDESPYAGFSAQTGGAIGFSFARGVVGNVVSAGQPLPEDTFEPILGVGQSPGDLEASYGPLSGDGNQLQYGTPVLLSSGSYSSGVPTIGRVDGLVFGDVNAFNPFRRPAEFRVEMISFSEIPEPSAVVMLIMGVLYVLTRRATRS